MKYYFCKHFKGMLLVINNNMSLIKDYFDKTSKHSEEFGELTIVLMQVGAFFEVYGLKDSSENVYGSNIMHFSRICDLNVVDKKVCCGSTPVVMAGFKEHLLDKYVKKLQESGYTIAVYEQDEQCANTTRSLTGIYSPGTYFSNDYEVITNNTCCIWIEIKKNILRNNINKNNIHNTNIFVGASVIDIYTGTSSMMEYKEQYVKNPTTFDELERFISIYNPSETIIICNLPKSEIDDIVSYTNIKSKSIHIVELEQEKELSSLSKNIQRAKNCEKQTYQKELLSKFYKINDMDFFMNTFNDNVYATQSFCYLLDFIYQHNPNLIYKISEPNFENTNNRLILANHSLKQLHIIDDGNYKDKYSSVVKMLNECITSMGKRKFTDNFLNPITSEDILTQEYNMIEKLLTKSDDYQIVKVMLANIKDIAKINRQIVLQKISPKALYQLYTGITVAKNIYNFIINNDLFNDLSNYLKNKIKITDFNILLQDMEDVTEYINSVFIINDCKDIDNIQKIEKSFIKNGVNIELDNKIKTLMESQDQLECCRSYFNSIISNYETKTVKKPTKKKVSKDNDKNKNEDFSEDLELVDEEKNYVKIHETEKNNFSILATDRRCKILEEILSKIKTNIQLKYTSSYFDNDSLFTLEIDKDPLEFVKQSASNKSITNKQINKLCKNVGSIKINLIDTIIKVYEGIIKNLENYIEKIERICDFITYIDLVYAKMYVAIKYNYCKPEIVQTESGKSFIQAEDLRHCLIEKRQNSEIYVANDITIGDGKLDGILLYGTNAVGKTSFMRAIGISIIIAQAGLYVPASSYKYKPYKYIFTRILANDNIFKGLSTFAVEMSELRTILRLSNKNSLVLGDELCSGTESISATSIFVSGVQALHKKSCSFIFATHLHEIIDYDEITSLHNVALKHMSVIYDKERDCLVYDRKLKDGPGNNMYGLEVCKSLALPDDFLENAHNIRMKYHPNSDGVLNKKPSHFNANHIKDICEKCGKNSATEVHHLIYQEEANDKGIIKKKGLTFHKNHPANLLSLCEKCHDEIHKKGTKVKKTKTTKGVILKEL